MMSRRLARNSTARTVAALVAVTFGIAVSFAQTSQPEAGSDIAPAKRNGASRAVAPRASGPRPSELSPKAIQHYQILWGVDSFVVKSAESGQMIRFSYRVVDAEKAKVLNDKKNEPYLIDEQARVQLVIPTMEKVGQLRQSAPPENGKVYWMVFSNKGGHVKPGNRVEVVIGSFRVNGLVVE